MSDQDRFGPDDAWERELAELGPLMRRQEQAETAEPDPAFVRALRSRLVGPEPTTAPIPMRRKRLWPRLAFGGVVSAAAAAAAAVALVLGSHNARAPGQLQVAFALPTPDATSLAQSFPVYGLGGGGGVPEPWADTAGIPGGAPYAGHLRLRAGTLPSGPRRLPAHRLAGPEFAAPRIRVLAATLGIPGQVKRSTQPSGRWAYVWKKPRLPSDPIDRSVAVNLQTGQLIFHNFNLNSVGPGQQLPLNDPANVAAARVWLTSLGWPGAQMPVHQPTSPQEAARTNSVTLDWAGAGSTDVPAATIEVAHGTIIDATLWPPVSRSGSVPARGYPAAWAEVRAGRVPIGLAGQIYPPKNGSGALERKAIFQVFIRTPAGALYLAPAYRFEGTASIQGTGSYHWYAFVPAEP
jgi:hypothetical protein